MQKSDVRSSATAGEAKLHFLDYWRVIRVRLGIVILSFLLVVITAGITTYFMPRKFRSSITVELRMPQMDQRLFKNSGESMGSGIDAGYAATQFEIIQRKEILYPVVDSLDLPHRWAIEGSPISREQAYWKLRGMLTLKPIRATELLDIGVTSTVAQEAALLVNAVVQSYETALKTNSEEQTGATQTTIDADLAVQRKKVEDLNHRLLKMQQDNPLIEDANLNQTTGQRDDPRQERISAKEQEVNKSQTIVAGLESQLTQVQKLKGDELMRALATLDIQDPTVQKVLPQYQEAVSTEASLLNSGLGSNHPKLKSLRASKDVFVKQLTEQIESIKHSLAIRLEIAQKTLQSVTSQLEDARKSQTALRVSSVEYNQLKDEYLKSREILNITEQKQSIEKVDGKITRRPFIIWDKAEPAVAPSSPNVYLNMVLGVLVGIVVGVGLAFFIEYLDTSVKTMDDVEAMLGVPVLAIVPKNIKLLHKQVGDVPDAEAYRILRTNIEFNRKSADANTVSMVSGGPGEGKSTTLCNLAFICAQGGYSVLIVDADLRRPTQHKLFEMSNTVGLTNYLTTNVTLEDVIMSTSVENLFLMPSGILPADAVGILNSQRMSDMIAELKTRFDIIFFDSPPILGVSDGAVLASEVDQSIIIVQHRRFPRSMLQRVKQSISNVGGTVLGVVLNNVDLRHDPNYAYYTSYYEYYTNRNVEQDSSAGRRNGDRPAGTPAATAGRSGNDPASY